MKRNRCVCVRAVVGETQMDRMDSIEMQISSQHFVPPTFITKFVKP